MHCIDHRAKKHSQIVLLKKLYQNLFLSNWYILPFFIFLIAIHSYEANKPGHQSPHGHLQNLLDQKRCLCQRKNLLSKQMLLLHIRKDLTVEYITSKVHSLMSPSLLLNWIVHTGRILPAFPLLVFLVKRKQILPVLALQVEHFEQWNIIAWEYHSKTRSYPTDQKEQNYEYRRPIDVGLLVGLLSQQVLNGQIGSPKSFEFKEFFSQGKHRLRTLIFF